MCLTAVTTAYANNRCDCRVRDHTSHNPSWFATSPLDVRINSTADHLNIPDTEPKRYSLTGESPNKEDSIDMLDLSQPDLRVSSINILGGYTSPNSILTSPPFCLSVSLLPTAVEACIYLILSSRARARHDFENGSSPMFFSYLNTVGINCHNRVYHTFPDLDALPAHVTQASISFILPHVSRLLQKVIVPCTALYHYYSIYKVLHNAVLFTMVFLCIPVFYLLRSVQLSSYPLTCTTSSLRFVSAPVRCNILPMTVHIANLLTQPFFAVQS